MSSEKLREEEEGGGGLGGSEPEGNLRKVKGRLHDLELQEATTRGLRVVGRQQHRPSTLAAWRAREQ